MIVLINHPSVNNKNVTNIIHLFSTLHLKTHYMFDECYVIIFPIETDILDGAYWRANSFWFYVTATNPDAR